MLPDPSPAQRWKAEVMRCPKILLMLCIEPCFCDLAVEIFCLPVLIQRIPTWVWTSHLRIHRTNHAETKQLRRRTSTSQTNESAANKRVPLHYHATRYLTIARLVPIVTRSATSPPQITIYCRPTWRTSDVSADAEFPSTILWQLDHLRPPEHTQDQQASLWWWFCGEQRQIMIRRPSTHGENRRSLVLRFMCQSSQTADDFVHFVHFWSPKHSPESTTKPVLHVQSKSLRHRCKSTAGKDAGECAPGWDFQPRKLQKVAAEYYTINSNAFDWGSY